MKKLLSVILLVCLVLTCVPALAESYELNGTVVSALTQNITSAYGGVVDQVLVRVGQTVHTGDILAILQTSKVYAKESGTVYLFGSVGDDAESIAETYGSVAYLESELAYSVTGNTKYAYDNGANKLIHPGESVMLRTTTGEATGRGIITSVTDSSFEVLVTAPGSLVSGDSANIYRSGTFEATSRIGRGTVTRRGPSSYTAAGIIVGYAVSSGQRVTKGSLLFETVSGTYRGDTGDMILIKAPADGVIASLGISPGSTVAEGGDVATLYPIDALRIEATARESDLVNIRVGDAVRIELIYAGNGDNTLDGQVEYISSLGAASTTDDTEESSFSVYITASDPDMNSVLYGMNAIISGPVQPEDDGLQEPEEIVAEEVSEDE